MIEWVSKSVTLSLGQAHFMTFAAMRLLISLHSWMQNSSTRLRYMYWNSLCHWRTVWDWQNVYFRELDTIFIFAFVSFSLLVNMLEPPSPLSRFQRFFCGQRSRMKRRVPIWLSLQSTLTTWATGTVPLPLTQTVYSVHANTRLVIGKRTVIPIFYQQEDSTVSDPVRIVKLVCSSTMLLLCSFIAVTTSWVIYISKR